MGKSGKKWRKVRISGESWGKKGKSGNKLEKVDFFCKMAAGGHFGRPKITFDRISRHFRSIRNFYFLNLFWAILDDRKSLSIAFLTISDQYATFVFDFFSKWPPAAIL